MVVGPKYAIATVLVELNLAVRYRITIIYIVRVRNNTADFNLVVAMTEHQTAKFFWLYSIIVKQLHLGDTLMIA